MSCANSFPPNKVPSNIKENFVFWSCFALTTETADTLMVLPRTVHVLIHLIIREGLLSEKCLRLTNGDFSLALSCFSRVLWMEFYCIRLWTFCSNFENNRCLFFLSSFREWHYKHLKTYSNWKAVNPVLFLIVHLRLPITRNLNWKASLRASIYRPE